MNQRTQATKHFAAALLLAVVASPASGQEPVEPMLGPSLTPPQQQSAAKPAPQPAPVHGVHCGSACMASPCCGCHCPILGGCAHCPVLYHPLALRCRDLFPVRKHVQKGPPPYAALPPKPPTFLPVPPAPVYTPMQAQASHLIPTVIPTAPGSYLHLPVAY